MTISKPFWLTIAAVTGVGVGGKMGWTSLVQDPLKSLEKKATAAKSKKDKTYRATMNARVADAELADYEKLCLPGRPTLAQEAFQNELIDACQRAKVGTPTLTPGSPVIRSDVVVTPYTLQGESDQAGVARLLYELRRAPRLRQVRRLSLTPIERAGMAPAIRFNLNVEALGLGDATARAPAESFAPAVRDRLTDYAGWLGRTVLSARGPVAAELPARSADYVILTGIAGSVDRLEANAFDRATGKSWRIRVGDGPGVGGDDALVRDIGSRDLVLESKGGFAVWRLGTPYAARTAASVAELIEREARNRQARKR